MIAKNNIETYNIFNPRHMRESIISVFDDELYSTKIVYGEKVKLDRRDRARRSDKYFNLNVLSRYHKSGFQEYDNFLEGFIIFKDLSLPWELNVAKAMKLAYGIIADLNKSYPDRYFSANYDFNHNYIEMTIMISDKNDRKRGEMDPKKGDIKRVIKLIKRFSNLYKEHPEFFSRSYNTLWVKGDALEGLGFQNLEDEFIYHAQPIMSRNTNTGVFSTPFTPTNINYMFPFDIGKIMDIVNTYMLDITHDDDVFLSYINDYVNSEPLSNKPEIPQSNSN